MSRDLDYLVQRMERIARTVEVNAPRAVTTVALAIAPVLVYATPVDTSRARANWRGSIGGVPSDILYAFPDRPPTPNTGAPLGIRSITDAANRYAGGSYLAISNNTPYIQKLNDGWSSQAPAAFVQLAIVAGIRSLRGFRILRNV